MAAPTIAWYRVTGASPSRALITILDYGNVQAGYWSDVRVIQAYFTGNSANTLKFWLNDTAATGGNVNVANSNNWQHHYAIDYTYIDPAGLSDAVKAGSSADSNGRTWTDLPETEPVASNFENTTVNSGAYTDYVFMAIQPPSNAGDGLTEAWGYRLSFLYP